MSENWIYLYKMTYYTLSVLSVGLASAGQRSVFQANTLKSELNL